MHRSLAILMANSLNLQANYVIQMDIAETVVQCYSPCSTEAPHTPAGNPISVSSYLLNVSTDTYL